MTQLAEIGEDQVRGRLLDAAVRVFARKGYAGTRVLDITREAGLSTTAIYGRFGSKDALLREAVVARSKRSPAVSDRRVSELIARMASWHRRPLTDEEAVQLEAYVEARREPEVAAALQESRRHHRRALQPLVKAAEADGTVAPDVDSEAVLFFVQTLRLGLLLQRGAGVTGPDPKRWSDLVDRIVASFGRTPAREIEGMLDGAQRVDRCCSTSMTAGGREEQEERMGKRREGPPWQTC